MTELLYLSDAYAKTFDARVKTAFDDQVALDCTAFFPGGGGQPCDLGSLVSDLKTWRVIKVRKDDTDLWHTVEGDGTPDVGCTVVGEIDWKRRYQIMRTHTAMHILSAVIWRDYRASVTGGNMSALKGRMDFEFDTMRAELVLEIEYKINEEVAAGRPVRVNTLPREEAFQIPHLIRTKVNLIPDNITEVRTIEIEGLDLQADGGTHVSNTSEVGRIRVTDYKSKGAMNKRIVVTLD